MPKKFFLATCVLCAIAFVLSGQRPPRAPARRIAAVPKQGFLKDAALEQSVRAALTGAPLSFEENLGQTNPRIKFVARGGNFMLALAPEEADLHVHTPHVREKRPAQLDPEGMGWADAMAASARVRLEFAGGNPATRLEGVDPQPGTINYFKGSDPSRWQRNVPHFDRVQYVGLYPGIDAVFYGNRRAMEFDFVVAPGADPSAIRMHVEGAGSVELTDEGGLVARTAAGDVMLLPPQLYQKSGGERSQVAGRFVWRAPGEIGFEVASYNHAEALVIDPQAAVKQWGVGKVSGRQIVANQAGKGKGPGHGKYGAPPDTPPPTGGSVSLSTFLGGSYDDSIEGMAVSATTGHVYVTGFEDSFDFPVLTEGGYGPGGTPYLNCQIPQSPCGDAFVAEFNVSTITAPVLVTSTYIGGSNDDVAWGIALDANDDPYIIGQTDSLDFPTTANAVQCVLGQYGCDGGTINYPVPNSGCGTATQPRACHHVFFSVLSSDLSQLTYSTYLAGADDDEGYAVAVDSNGLAFLTGTAGAYFADTNYCDCNAFQNFYNGGGDAFFVILDPTPDGEGLEYITYFGGFETDAGLAIALDANDDAFIGGVTFSTIDGSFANPCENHECEEFLITEGALQYQTIDTATCGPGGVFTCGDGFVVEFQEFQAPGVVPYGTFVGGSGADQVNAILVDEYMGIDVLAVTGQSQQGPGGSDFVPVTNCLEGCGGGSPAGPPYQASNQGGYDAFLVVFSPGFEIYATYLGGQYDDIGLGITSDANGDIFISGSTESGPGADPGFPLASPLQSQTNASYANPTSFVSVFGLTGNLIFSTYYGGLYDYYNNPPTDVGTSIALDTNGNIYLAGRSTSFGNTSNTPNPYGSPGLCFINQIPGANADQDYYNDYNGFMVIISPTSNGGANSGAAACFSPALVNWTSATTNVPLTFNFGGTLVDTANPSPQALTIYNQGSKALTTEVSFTGANAGDFTEMDNCANVAGGGASCQILVTFTPTASTAGGPAPESATMVIGNNANCPTVTSCTVALTGTSLPPATVGLSLTPGSLSCSVPLPVTYVEFCASSTLTVTNTSTTGSPLTITPAAYSLGGADPGDFPVIALYCAGYTLQPGNSCSMQVGFVPQAVGTRMATLTVLDNGALTPPQTVTITGTETLPPPTVSVPPLSLLFGPQVQATTSIAQTVTITNSAVAGSANLVVNQPLTFTGANAGDFAAMGCTTAVAPAGGSCTITVTFTPQAGAAGARNAALQIASNASNSPQSISLTGTDLAFPTITITPTPPGPVTFPPQVVMTPSAAMNVTLTNTSTTSPLSIASPNGIALTGGNMGDFAIASNGCGTSLAANASCVVSVTFTPTATGMRTTTLQFTDNASGTPASPQMVTLNGTGVTAPTLTPQPILTFATPQGVGTTSAPAQAMLNNPNTVSMNVNSVVATGDFAVVPANPCGAAVAANSTCTISVVFTPTATGTRNGVLTVVDQFGTQSTNLTGTGTTPAAVTLAPATSAAAPYNFGVEAVGVTSAAVPFTVTNTGGSPLTISAIAPTGDFGEMDNCIAMSPLAANGGMCTIMVTFTPGVGGPLTGSIVIVDNAANSPQMIYLAGTGSGTVPGFNLSAPLYFGAVLEGTTSAPQMITITNSGGATLNIMSVTPSAEFNVPTNTCGMVPIGMSCMLTVTFTPTMTGLQTGTLTFTDNAPGSPQVVSLSGIGATVTMAPPPGGTNTLTVLPGDTASYPLNVSGTPGLVVTLNLTCVSTAPYSICTVKPSQITLGGAAVPVITVTVETNCNTSLMAPPTGGSPPILPAPFAGLWVGTLVLFVMLRRVLPRPWLARAAPALLLMLLVITWAGCVSNPAPAIPGSPTTPAGNYVVTVTATGANGVNVMKVLTLMLRVV